jgi:hypothetical protein
MDLFHRTYDEAAQRIREHGFGGADGYAGTRVFVAERAEDIPIDIDGDAWILFVAPDRAADELEEHRYGRGWLVPAELLDRYGRPRIIDPPALGSSRA